jgi:2-polyprenyl-3-methyl-5-hydroxy-6-metoxy-1,4-benzoquinol methylase
MSHQIEHDPKAYDSNEPFFLENKETEITYCKRICTSLESRKFDSGLSLGLGHGFTLMTLLKQLGSKISKYKVIEGDPEMIHSFLKKIELPASVEITKAFFENFETKDKFDFIEMGFVLEHVEDPEFILKKYKQYLKPEGVIFIAVPNARSLHRLIGKEAGLLEDVFKLSEMDFRFGHKRYFDLNSIIKCVENVGMKVVKSEGIYLKPLTEKQMISLNLNPKVWEALFSLSKSYPEISNSIFLEVKNAN